MLAKDHYSDNGQMVVNRGEWIYRDLYQDEYESRFGGQYLVIEVLTKRAYVMKVKTDDPNGLFHLIEIQESPKGIKSYVMKVFDYVRRLGDIKQP